MEKQRWKESEKRSAEERRSEKRKSETRKGRKVAISLCFSNDLWFRRVFISRLTAGAEPSGQMRNKKLQGLLRKEHLQVKKLKNTSR